MFQVTSWGPVSINCQTNQIHVERMEVLSSLSFNHMLRWSILSTNAAEEAVPLSWPSAALRILLFPQQNPPLK